VSQAKKARFSWKNQEERLEQIICEVADELGIKVLKLAINPDHLHLFVSAYPTISVHKIVKRIKGRSSRILTL